MCSDFKMLKVSPEFHKMLTDIQQQRIDNGKELVIDKVSLKQLTKVMTNMFNANMEILNSLVEVDI